MPRPSNCSTHSAGSRCHARPVVSTSALQAISRAVPSAPGTVRCLNGPSIRTPPHVERREDLDLELVAPASARGAPGPRPRCPPESRGSSRCGSSACLPARALAIDQNRRAALPTPRRPRPPGPPVRRRRWPRRRWSPLASTLRPDLPRDGSAAVGRLQPLAVRHDHQRQGRRPSASRARLGATLVGRARRRRTRRARGYGRGTP